MERAQYENDYAPIALTHDLAVLPYFSLASGFLTGKYRSREDAGKSPRGGSVIRYLEGSGAGILDALDTVSKKHRAEIATVSLAWLLSRPHVAAPIASATNETQLGALLAAPTLRLDAGDLELLNSASAP